MQSIHFPNISKVNHLTLCLGNFDGVHLGHQKLIFEAKKNATGPIGVLLFSDSPSNYIPSKKSHRLITSLEDKIRIFSTLGVDYAFVIDVNKDFFLLSKEEFIEKYVAALSPEIIVCGSDYRFGRNASGSLNDLKKLTKVVEVDLLKVNSLKVSTQDIISLIENGKITDVSTLLGKDYEVSGTVIKGLKNGEKLSYPTANISLKYPYVIPKSGVYSGYTYVNGIPYLSMINVGTNPTIGVLKEPIIESHLLNFKGDLYGKFVYISFQKFIRNEKIFANLEELKKQLDEDFAKINSLY